jgi:hypothetical protein
MENHINKKNFDMSNIEVRVYLFICYWTEKNHILLYEFRIFIMQSIIINKINKFLECIRKISNEEFYYC